MFSWVFLLFVFMPALELYVLFKIGGQIGLGNTFGVILLTGALGAYLAKLNGLSVLHEIQKEMAEGKVPGNQILQAFLIFGGGLLLLTPGFVTDILGFCMVLPGTRFIFSKFLATWFKKAIARGSVQFYQFGQGGGFSASSSSQSRDAFKEKVNSVYEAEYTKKED